MLMRRVEELMPAATISPLAQVAAASSLFSQSSPLASLTTGSDYWTTISASPPLPRQHGALLHPQLQQPPKLPQQNPRKTSLQSHCSLTPALLLEELVLAEEGDQGLLGKYIKQQRQQLPQQLQHQQPSSCDLNTAERELSSNSDDNNNNNNALQMEVQKLLCRHLDDDITNGKSRPRTYSIESLLERRDSISDFRKWTDDDPMWNENLYVEIDDGEDDCGAIGGAGGAGSTNDPDSTEDIFTLFPFPLSISSPPLTAENDAGRHGATTGCVSDSAINASVRHGASNGCATHNARITSFFHGFDDVANVVADTSPSSKTANAVAAVIPSLPIAPDISYPSKTQPGLSSNVPSASLSQVPGILFEEKDEGGEENEESEKKTAIAAICSVDDAENEDEVDLDDFSGVIIEGLISEDDAVFLSSDEFPSSDLTMGMTTSSENGVNCFAQPLGVDDLLRVVDGSVKTASPLNNPSQVESSNLSQKHQQRLQMQQQQQRQSRQRRQSISRRQRQQQQLRQQQQQRRRRRSWTVVKPKIHRHSSLKNAKSPTRGITPVVHHHHQQQHQQRLRLQQDLCDVEVPLVSTSSLPLDHQGLCKPIEDPKLSQSGSSIKFTSTKSSCLKSRTTRSERDRNNVQVSRSPLDVAAANRAREHLNIVERQRRFVLAQAMDKLRDELPYQSEDERRKLSKLEILRGAKEFIYSLRQQEVALQDEKAELSRKQKTLMKRLNSLNPCAKGHSNHD